MGEVTLYLGEGLLDAGPIAAQLCAVDGRDGDVQVAREASRRRFGPPSRLCRGGVHPLQIVMLQFGHVGPEGQLLHQVARPFVRRQHQQMVVAPRGGVPACAPARANRFILR